MRLDDSLSLSERAKEQRLDKVKVHDYVAFLAGIEERVAKQQIRRLTATHRVDLVNEYDRRPPLPSHFEKRAN